MRWLFILIYFLLVGCVSTAVSGAKVIYCHKQVQEELTDYYISISAWNNLKSHYTFTDLSQLHLTSFHKILLMTGQLPTTAIRCGIEHSLQTLPKVARIYNATTVEPPISVSEQIKDSWITTKVKSKLIASNELYADKIKVVTEKQIVYLIGIVTEHEGDAAIKLAKTTTGVKNIITIFYYMTMPKI